MDNNIKDDEEDCLDELSPRMIERFKHAAKIRNQYIEHGERVGIQLIAVRIIKEQLKKQWKGQVVRVDRDNLVNWTGFTKKEVDDLVETCIGFQQMKLARTCADTFDGNWDYIDRYWFERYIYKKGRKYLKLLCQGEEFDIDLTVNLMRDTLNEERLWSSEASENARNKETVEQLLIHFRNYFITKIEVATHSYDWKVIKLMGDFDFTKEEIFGLVQKYGARD